MGKKSGFVFGAMVLSIALTTSCSNSKMHSAGVAVSEAKLPLQPTQAIAAGWNLVGLSYFNEDLVSDYLFFNTTTRNTSIWFMANTGLATSSLVGTPIPAGWTLVGAADFDSDMNADFLLFNPSTTRTAIWYLKNGVFNSANAAYGPNITTGWSVAGVADFDKNLKPDLLLFNSTTGQVGIWYMDDNVYVKAAMIGSIPPGWTVTNVADVNKDGKSDLILLDSASRKSAVWYLDNNMVIKTEYGPVIPLGWSVALQKL